MASILNASNAMGAFSAFSGWSNKLARKCVGLSTTVAGIVVDAAVKRLYESRDSDLGDAYTFFNHRVRIDKEDAKASEQENHVSDTVDNAACVGLRSQLVNDHYLSNKILKMDDENKEVDMADGQKVGIANNGEDLPVEYESVVLVEGKERSDVMAKENVKEEDYQCPEMDLVEGGRAVMAEEEG